MGMLRAVTVSLTLGLAGAAHAASAPEAFFPEKPDPFAGDWKGRWSSGDVDPDIAAHVIALGDGNYRIRLVPKLYMRCPPVAIVEAKASRRGLSFESGSLRGEIRGDRFTGSRGKSTFEMKKVVRQSPTLGAKAPEGAVALFDGSNFDAWETPEGWELLDGGAMMVTPKGKYLVSKQRFTDVKLHVEFRNSFMPKARGQDRSNSGVFVQDVYEVQVLDSYGLEGYYNECGALYKVAAPRVNACAPPSQWQTYDIDYRAPRLNSAGDLTENARITVRHNGTLIHNDQELWWITAWTEKERLGPAPSDPGPIKLQGHNNYVQYRNIWLVDLAKGE